MNDALVDNMDFLSAKINEEIAGWEEHVKLIDASSLPALLKKSAKNTCKMEINALNKKLKYIETIREAYKERVAVEASEINETDPVSASKGGGSKPS